MLKNILNGILLFFAVFSVIGCRADNFVICKTGNCSAAAEDIAAFGDYSPVSEIAGVPFDMTAPVIIDQTAEGRYSVDMGGIEAKEIYFVMGNILPARKVSGNREEDMHWFDTPERFVVDVEYTDGIVDEVFPLNPDLQTFWIRRGTHWYCLPELRECAIKRITFRNRMETGKFLLWAVTANTGAPLQKINLPEWQPAYAPAFELPRRNAYIKETGYGFEISDGQMIMQLGTVNGIEILGWDSLLPEYAGRVKGGKGAVFSLNTLLEGAESYTRATSDKVSVGKTTADNSGAIKKLTVSFDASSAGVPWEGVFTVTVDQLSSGIVMDLAAEYTGTETLESSFNFPLVNDISIDNSSDTWCLWMQRGEFFVKGNLEWMNFTGHYCSQFTDAFNPGTGVGVMLMTMAKDDPMRLWRMNKTDDGVDWDIAYCERFYAPEEKFAAAPSMLRLHSGDWRNAFNIYKDWLYSWYTPLVPRKKWFQEVFSYQQTTCKEFYNRETGKLDPQRAIDYFRSQYKYLDYLRLHDFGFHPDYGRVGSYNEYYWGGREEMARAIQQIKDQGVVAGLYLEGYLCDERTVWGDANFEHSAMRNRDNSIPTLMVGDTLEYFMCPAEENWREYLSNAYAQAAADIAPDAMYIDQIGQFNKFKACYSAEHGHPVPLYPSVAEAGMLTSVRKAIPESVVLLSEETPTDTATRYYDGSLTYSVNTAHPNLQPCRIDLMRFLVPSFKQIQLVQYNAYNEVNGWDLLKFPFFNGQGYWFHCGIGGDDQYNRESLEYLTKVFTVMHEYIDCFSSEKCEALLPSLHPAVFINRFDGDGRSAYTVSNRWYKTIRTPVMEVPHRNGTRYIDAFTGREIQWEETSAGTALVSVPVGPHDVACVIAEY